MKMIANITGSLGLGLEGRLLSRIPEDMKFFRDETMGKTVVMGRKTLSTLPGGRPLRGRTNIVLSSNPEKLLSEITGEIDPRAGSGCEASKEEPAAGKTAVKVGETFSGILDLGDGTRLAVCEGREAALSVIRDIYGDYHSDDVYIIGGESIYRLFFSDCDTLLLTETDIDAPADKFFPEFRESGEWMLSEQSEEKEFEGTHYRFDRYERAASDGT